MPSASSTRYRGLLPGRRGATRAAVHAGLHDGRDRPARAAVDGLSSAKLAETQALLIRAAAEFGAADAGLQPGRRRRRDHAPGQRLAARHPGVRAGHRHAAPADARAAGARTKATLARTGRRSTGRCNESVVQFVAREGKEPMYRQHRAAQGLLPHPQGGAAASARWPARRAWITGLRREQSTRACRRAPDRPQRAARQVNPLTDWTWGDVVALHRAERCATTTRCTTSSTPASAARPAPAPSASARTSAPAAGGGKTRAPRSAACTCTDQRARTIGPA